MTHDVFNQVPPLSGYNVFECDPALREALTREGAAWASAEVTEFGRHVGSEEVIRWGFEANENPPVLRTHDRYGNRRDEVEFHPAWHRLMALSVEFGIHSLPWESDRPGAHVARAALMRLTSENEAGHGCPVSMTYSAVPALRKNPEIAREWEPMLRTREYDGRFAPAPDKTGVLIGMGMTEKQGGSDVRANTTTAESIVGEEYRVTGHKWFCSAPMCDAFLILAQAPGGLTCFFLPRWTPDGAKNRFHLQRLKSKLGNRSNASSEVEFEGAWARRIGEEGRGVPAILEMVTHTRLDCVIGAAAMMRQSLVQAVHHARHRCAFGKHLSEQPLMERVLADLAIESEAASALMMRLARAFDTGEKAFARLATAVSKFWVTKRAAAFTAEALECLGGNGYVEESMMPRIYREAPLNSIWEGSGNVICLDVLRAMAKEPDSVDALLAEIRGVDAQIDRFVDRINLRPEEGDARRTTSQLAVALQAALLVRYAPDAVAVGFCKSRLGGGDGRVFGTLEIGRGESAEILARSLTM
ncbi:MAG: isovaleryl-CoA dehydrogenase [Bryobacteraceae bacterium]